MKKKVGIECVTPPSKLPLNMVKIMIKIKGDTTAQLMPNLSLNLLRISLKKMLKITSFHTVNVERLMTTAIVIGRTKADSAFPSVVCYRKNNQHLT